MSHQQTNSLTDLSLSKQTKKTSHLDYLYREGEHRKRARETEYIFQNKLADQQEDSQTRKRSRGGSQYQKESKTDHSLHDSLYKESFFRKKQVQKEQRHQESRDHSLNLGSSYDKRKDS